MKHDSSRRRGLSRRRRVFVFALGAALGSGLGLVLGSMLTAWLGPSALRAIQRVLRRISGDDSHPSYDLLPQ